MSYWLNNKRDISQHIHGTTEIVLHIHYSRSDFSANVRGDTGKSTGQNIAHYWDIFWYFCCFANLSLCSKFEKFREHGLRLSNFALSELLIFLIWRWFYNSKKMPKILLFQKSICTLAAETLRILFISDSTFSVR